MSSSRNLALLGVIGSLGAFGATLLYLHLQKSKQRSTKAAAGNSSSSSTTTTKWPTFSSTRGWKGEENDSEGCSFEDVVLLGLAPDSGLFVPSFFPKVSAQTLLSWRELSFQDLAVEVMSLYIPPSVMTKAKLSELVHSSYDSSFRESDVTPLVRVKNAAGGEDLLVMELFHGPTFAFKDVALQFPGNLFEYLLSKREGKDAEITVLGATSGDTGSSAIYGLRGKKGINVFILFPEGRVSEVQEKQMTTVPDANVHCISVTGSFDDAQAIVKTCFVDEEFRSKYNLAAVNSINFARILAQIVYYFYAYFQVYGKSSSLDPSNLPKLSFSVPTGNFGDILAGYYAKLMGLPVGKLLVATNENDILDSFFQRGKYHKQPQVKPTNTPSMDICVSSNFERFLYHMCDNDATRLASLMKTFEKTGKLDADDSLLRRAQREMISAAVDEKQVLETIGSVYKERQYLLDPHSAIGVAATQRLLSGKAGEPPVVNLLTAHWSKFTDAVTKAIGVSELKKNEMPVELKRIMSLPTRKVIVPAEVNAVKTIVNDIMSKQQ